MFDKDLFFALCEKYNVELNDSANEPMMKDGNGVHPITNEDVSRVFTPCQAFFGYSGKKLDANVVTIAYYLKEDFAIAC